MPSALVCALAAALLSCSRAPVGGAALESLQVSETNLAQNPELGLSAEQARQKLQTALESTNRFALRGGRSGARVRLEIDSARRILAAAAGVGPDRELAEVNLTLELTSPTPQGDWERVLAEGAGRSPTGGEGGPDPGARLSAFEAALTIALEDAARGLAWQLEARRKPDAELVKDLSAADPRVRDYAVRALAERRNPAAVPQLVSRLQDDSPVVVLRAVGALVAIGDRRAVRPLIELTKKRPPQLVAQILYALGSLGGSEAEAFLYTLESGSPDEEVRRAAAEAFAELRRKRDESGTRDRRRPRTP